jgi:hypothetical protein
MMAANLRLRLLLLRLRLLLLRHRHERLACATIRAPSRSTTLTAFDGHRNGVSNSESEDCMYGDIGAGGTD